MRGRSVFKGGVAAWGFGLAATVLVGCTATTFEGNAKFPGGVAGCIRQCTSRNLEMASFIYVGEYSSACVCKPVKKATSAAAELETPACDEGDVTAAVVGVTLEQRARMQHALVAGPAGAALPP